MKYYKDEVIPLERHKIRSIVDTLSVMYNLLSEEEYIALFMKN